MVKSLMLQYKISCLFRCGKKKLNLLLKILSINIFTFAIDRYVVLKLQYLLYLENPNQSHIFPTLFSMT